MELPKAPAWFVKELKRFDSKLSVRYNLPGRNWQILVDRKEYVDRGEWNGIKLVELVNVPQHVVMIPECGSRVFKDLRERDRKRWRNYDHFVQDMRIA